MGKYGYGSWGAGYGGGDKRKRVWSSTSGWETSHFGGYNRLIYDYPYIKFDYKANIEIPQGLRTQLGIWSAEKLIKMYVMKCKEIGLTNRFARERITKKNIIGREKQFDVLNLNNPDILDAVMSSFKEFAPLFDHYREDILSSSIQIEVPEDSNQGKGKGQNENEDQEENEGQGDGEGEGEGEGEGDGQGDGQGEGDGEGEGEPGKGEGKENQKGKGGGWGPSSTEAPDFKELERVLNEMTEQKPFEGFGRLGAESYPKFIPPQKFDQDYKFNADEIRDAEMIIKQLDINFEPKSDEVKNLKLGKLDTSKLAEVPAGNISVYKQTLEDQDTKPFAICVLADMSGSMEGRRLETQFRVLNSLYLALSEIIPEEDLHIYGHSGNSAEPKIYTFCSPYHPDYRKNIRGYYQVDNQSNYDGIVIEQVHKKIREKTDRPVILVSLSDGQPCDSVEDMKRILERARRDQFVTVGIGIGTEYVKHLYNYSRVVYDEKLHEMPREVAGIINHVVKTEFK